MWYNTLQVILAIAKIKENYCYPIACIQLFLVNFIIIDDYPLLIFFNLKSKHNFCMIILLSFKSLLHILDNRHRSVSFENILSQFVACLVILLILSFPEQKFLVVMKLSFFIVSFTDYVFSVVSKGLPQWLSCKESACQCKRLRKPGDVGSITGSGKTLWRRKWQSTPVFLPGKNPTERGTWWTAVHGET